LIGVVVLVALVIAVLAVIRSSNRSGGNGGGLPAAFRQTVRITIGDSQPTELPSNGYREYSFTLPERACTVTGRIVGIAGGNKDFQAYIMDDDNFLNWKTSHKAKVFWQTDKVAAASINAQLQGSGTFHLVISNMFSLMTSKTVTIQGEVDCP
jgi:hypothetical protein